MNKYLRATEMAHEVMKKFISEDCIAIDATAGNGYDTLFLAQNIGEKGKIYAFDVQAQALEKTKERLAEQRLLERVILIHDGHECFKKYIKEEVNLITYNLGYLPGGDKSIITSVQSTIASLQQGLGMLAPGGIISIVVYPGHSGGLEEAEQVNKLLHSLADPPWQVLSWKRINGKLQAPYLLIAHKRGD